jgi:riboflavin synthase
MFTGLIEATGRVAERVTTAGGLELTIEASLARELGAGDSLAVNGVCLTVVVAEGDRITADVGPETLRVTTLGKLTVGAMVNLERPLRADSRLGGHFVQGHVDATGRLEDRESLAAFDRITLSFPSQLAQYIIPKGSIAVDGISLTVADLRPDRFDVQVVPFTLEHTNLRALQPGDPVNLECDLIGKYVARAAELAAVVARS